MVHHGQWFHTSFILEFRITKLPRASNSPAVCARHENSTTGIMAPWYVPNLRGKWVHSSCREMEWGQGPLNLILSILDS